MDVGLINLESETKEITADLQSSVNNATLVVEHAMDLIIITVQVAGILK